MLFIIGVVVVVIISLSIWIDVCKIIHLMAISFCVYQLIRDAFYLRSFLLIFLFIFVKLNAVVSLSSPIKIH